MQSAIGNFLRKVADDCDKTCGGATAEELEKVARLQLQDHEDIKTLMATVITLKRKVDDLTETKEKKSAKVIKLHEQDPL